MHDSEAVERVVFEILLTHAFVALASQHHVIAKFAELLKHEILVSGLLKTHGL